MEIGVSDFIKALSKVKSLHWDPYLIEVKHFFFFGFIFYYYKWLNTSSWTSNNIVVVQCLHNATGSIDSNLPMFHNLTFLNFHVNSCRWLPHFAVLVFHKICYAQMMKCLFFFLNDQSNYGIFCCQENKFCNCFQEDVDVIERGKISHAPGA